MQTTEKDYTIRSLIVAFLAAVTIPTQFVTIDNKFDNLPKSLPSLIGFFLSISILRNSKHELSEAEKEISDRFEGLDIREQQLNERELIIVNSEKTAKSERDRKQAELNSKIQKINDSEEDLSRRLEGLNQLIDDRAEVVAEKLNNNYLNRERELEQEFQEKHSEVINWYNEQREKLNKYKYEVDKKVIEIRTEYNFEIARHERKNQELELVIQKLNQRIRQFDAPRYAIGGDELGCIECNKIIDFLWQHEPCIKVDSEPLATPIQTGENSTRLWLRLRDPLQFSLLRSEKVLQGLRFVVGKNSNPIVQQEESTDLVRVTLLWNHQASKPEDLDKKSVESKLKDLSDYRQNSRSWIVTGHPGSGKTSTLIYLGQIFGDENSIKVALNPHQDTHSTYSQYGYIEINEISAILDFVNLFKEELELRRKDKERRFKLILAVDELGSILGSSENPTEVMQVFKKLAVEGRKLNLIVLLGNHSQTTKAVLFDAEFRGSFYQLFLVGAARYCSTQPHRDTGLSKLEQNYLQKSPYPALLLQNQQYLLAKHPTHHGYKQYRDKGNPPQNLTKINPNLTVEDLSKFLGKSGSKFDKLGVSSGKSEVSSDSGLSLEDQIEQLIEDLPIKNLLDEKSDFDLWLLIQKNLENHSKTYIVEKVLGCGGKYFRRASELVELLSKKYKNN